MTPGGMFKYEETRGVVSSLHLSTHVRRLYEGSLAPYVVKVSVPEPTTYGIKDGMKLSYPFTS